MALEVIGAGFGRTGTDSMREALTILGFGPCHHMSEVMASAEQTAIWRAIARGERRDWETAFAGFRSCVDWPSAFYWQELSEAYPQARMLLTVRSAESWHASMEKTIFRAIGDPSDRETFGALVIREQVFGGRLDRESAIAAYERNNAEVKAAFGPERLLVHALGDGWEPLCRFLGRPVPDHPYPRSNSTAEFVERLDTKGTRSESAAG